MKKLLVLLALLLLVTTAQAYDLGTCAEDANWTGVGNCLVRGAFGGDYLFFAIIMLLLFSIIMWQIRMPTGPSIAVGLIIVFAMGDMLGNHFITINNLILVSIGTMVGLAILHFVRR